MSFWFDFHSTSVFNHFVPFLIVIHFHLLFFSTKSLLHFLLQSKLTFAKKRYILSSNDLNQSEKPEKGHTESVKNIFLSTVLLWMFLAIILQQITFPSKRLSLIYVFDQLENVWILLFRAVILSGSFLSKTIWTISWKDLTQQLSLDESSQ